MAVNRKLLISLGVQKAGTSWFASYLRKHPSFGLPPLKEVHFFDYRDFGMEAFGRSRHEGLLGQERKVLESATGQARARTLHKISYLEDRIAHMDLEQATYKDYIKFVVKHSGKRPIACDVTPENGLLSLDRLNRLVALSAVPKFILVLRDPVDRAWSGVRMHALQLHRRGAPFEQSCLEVAETFLVGGDARLARWEDYASILSNARKAVPHDRLFVDVFENFMRQDRIDAFCDFMGVPHMQADFDQKQHEGMKMSLPADLKARFAVRLAKQYQAMEEALGPLPERWQKNRAAT